jgi:hypothetical protein
MGSNNVSRRRVEIGVGLNKQIWCGSMTQFSDREKAFENKFKSDQELAFRVQARRNKLLGLWAADQMGIEGASAESYAKDVVSSDFEKPGDDDVLQKVLADLTGKGVDISEHGLRVEMDKLMSTARAQFMEEE